MGLELHQPVWFAWTDPSDTGRITKVDEESGPEVKYYVVWDGKPPDENGWFTAELLNPVNSSRR